MRNKRRIMIALYHRDEFSMSPHRARLGLAAFHWGFLIVPKTSKGRDCTALDVSDAPQVDPIRRINLNPHNNWLFQNRTVNPMASQRFLIMGMIGKVDEGESDEMIAQILERIPMPRKFQTPEENCVSWARLGVEAL